MCYKFVLPETGRAVQLSRSKRERIIADLLYLVGVGRLGENLGSYLPPTLK
jgi:hypothetical protein